MYADEHNQGKMRFVPDGVVLSQYLESVNTWRSGLCPAKLLYRHAMGRQKGAPRSVPSPALARVHKSDRGLSAIDGGSVLSFFRAAHQW